MRINGKLKLIQDELDSIQCHVTLSAGKDGVIIRCKNDTDGFIAKAEVERAGLTVLYRIPMLGINPRR